MWCAEIILVRVYHGHDLALQASHSTVGHSVHGCGQQVAEHPNLRLNYVPRWGIAWVQALRHLQNIIQE